MASVQDLNCDTCNFKDVNSPAVQWCPECEEGLCAQCYLHHTHSKTSRRHGVIAVSDYKKLPVYIQNVKHYCQEHDEKFEFYCKSHNVPSCKKSSTTEHKNCKGVVPINDVIKDVKQSIEFTNIVNTVEKVRTKLDRMITSKETNLNTIQVTSQKIKSEIKEMRSKVISQLDVLEQQIHDNLSVIEAKLKEEAESFTADIKEQSRKLDELNEHINAVTNHASDFQTFVGMKELKTEADEKEIYLQSISADSRLDQVSITYNIDEKIKTLVSSIQKFGEIKMERVQIREKSAVMKPNVKTVIKPTSAIKPPNSKPVAALQPTLKRKLVIPVGPNKNTITGCTVLPNGKFVFVDGTYNQRVIILNTNGTTSGEISLSPSFAFDVARIDGTTIAISTGSSGQIAIANVATKKIKKFIRTTCQCDGITHLDGKLFFAVYSKGISMLQLTNSNISSIHDENITVDTHITSLEDRVYHSNWKANTVSCYHVSGKVMWTYKDEKLLLQPRGIAVDKEHNVYVSSLGTDSIILISPDGKQGTQFLSQKGEIENVRAIYFDREKNTLLLSTLSGSVLLYDV